MAKALVRIGYVYKAVYYPVPADVVRSFARMGPSTAITGSRVETTITLWQTWNKLLEYPIQFSPIGGWTLDVHHTYDLLGKALHLGDGTTRSAGATASNVIVTVAGTGVVGYSGDGGPATDAKLSEPWGVAVGPDGSVYYGDNQHYEIGFHFGNRVRRVGPDGIITTVVGNGEHYYSGDGGPATDAQIGYTTGLAVGPDGSLYIACQNNQTVRRVGPDGIITTVAGKLGSQGYSGDGGPATDAQLCNPTGMAVGPDGSFYFAESPQWNFGYHVRRVGPDGIISTVAGNGQCCYSGDGGPATNARISAGWVAVGPDGSLYIAAGYRIRRVGPDGIITTVAGNGQNGYAGDGGPATNARISAGWVAVGPDGSLYIGDSDNRRVRRVGPDGIITTVAGNGVYGYSGDGGPPTNASLRAFTGGAVGADGRLYIADTYNYRIRRVSALEPEFKLGEFIVASEDGARLYHFDATGRHLRTLSSLTGAVLYRFHYNDGLLTQVEDGDGNITTVERNAAGEPTGIVGPYGQRTTFTLDSNGYLAEITNPAGETLHFVYGPGGLLTEVTDAKGNRSVYDYDALGRLVKDTDAAGGSLSLARTDTPDGFDVATTTALGKVTTHRTEQLPAGGMTMVDTYEDGTTVQTTIGTNGTRTTTTSDGTIVSLSQGPDPRFGMQAPIVTATTVTTRGGLQKVTALQRTATLSEPGNPLSLLTLTDNVNINGRLYANLIDMSMKQRTMTSPEGRQLVTIFDAQGRIVRKQVGNLIPVSYGYDARGRLVAITRGSGPEAREFTIAYNAQGYPAAMSGPLSANVRLEFDADGRVSRQILGDGRIITYGYDAAGNIASITPPGRPSHLFTYSPVNLAREYTAPDTGAGASVIALAFDQDKRLTSMTRPDGSLVTMNYDSAGRPTTRIFTRGTIRYGYDPATGVLSSLTAPDGGVLTMEYDGYLTTKSAWTGTVTGTVDRVYDNNFWLIRRSVNGQGINFAYDKDGLLVQAGALTLTRDTSNGLVTETALGGFRDTWHYTGFGEMDEYRATYNSSDYYTTQYVYDKLGRIIQKTEEIMGGGSNVYAYSYDVTSQLTGVTLNGVNIATYTYDSNGNRLGFLSPSTTISGSYDSQDRLTQYGDITYTYTANGELSSKTDGGGTTTYQYNSLGNLVSVTLPGGTTIEYVIDGTNRRIGKKVNNVLVKGLLYKDELKPVAELDASNNVVSQFVYASRYNVPDYMITSTATYRIISDRLGSPRLVVDVATGQIAQRLDYDEFGRVVMDTNPGFQPFGFAGGLYDPDTDLVRFGARDYDPQTGRWTAKDLILFLGGNTNLYAYAFNDPVNHVDINGRQGGEDLPPGTSERTDFGDGDWQEAAVTQSRPNDPRIPRNIGDGPVDVVTSCFSGTCTETVWDPTTETSGEAQVSLDCQGANCGDLNKRALEDLQGFNPNKPVPPPGPAIPPSPSVDLPPLVPIPTGKNCNLNIWRDASGKVINVVKVK
jgi:RHS repeat-associated protein